MDIKHILICMILGYLFGSIPTGYLYAKLHGVDILHTGSGNPGSTNALRTMGVKGGVSVLCLDLMKTFIPIFILRTMFQTGSNEDFRTLVTLYTGLGVILGHNFPFTMKFRGGKGIACTGATLLAFQLPFALLLLVVFIAIVAVSKYVSLGSMLTLVVFFLACLLLRSSGILPFSNAIAGQVTGIAAVIMLSAIFMHRSNIRRLLNGTENKIGAKKSRAKS